MVLIVCNQTVPSLSTLAAGTSADSFMSEERPKEHVCWPSRAMGSRDMGEPGGHWHRHVGDVRGGAPQQSLSKSTTPLSPVVAPAELRGGGSGAERPASIPYGRLVQTHVLVSPQGRWLYGFSCV